MGRAYKILLVEDSETQALKLRYVLEEEGWVVEHTSTAEAALETLNESVPDLVVADYYLPGSRGDELCRQIRQNVNTRGIPILMLTSERGEAAELHGLESGADDYVAKSVETDVLILRVRALLRKSRVQSALLSGSEGSFRRARLLAIDDSPTYLEFVTEELRGEGYQVEKTLSPTEGLARVGSEAFDCVLVDLIMPEMDGVEVCRRLTEMRKAMDSPIVVLMLTAHESKEEMTRGLEAGADDFVGKSNDVAVLKARIRALLRRKFFQEDNRRISAELKNKELEAVRARAAKEAAEVRAALAEKLAETNRKLRDTQMHLIHSEKMASLGQLVAGIAHEINNPLAFVLNNLFTVETNLTRIQGEGGLSAEAAKRLDKARIRLEEMKEGLNRVKDLVLNLRTFSRLDEGHFKTVDVHQSIDSVLMFLRHKFGEDIQVIKDYECDGTLSCFAGQLNQVFMNLLANAAEAIDGAGIITITTRRDDDQFVVKIRDTGRGVSEAIRNKLFEPFFTTKPVGEGTGLGLSISYAIVEHHEGTIEVESEEGRGAEFTIRIPLDLEGDSAYPDDLRFRRGAKDADDWRVGGESTN